MQSILGGGVISLFLFALYAPWFTNTAMLAAIVASGLANLFLMAGIMELLPDDNVRRHLFACSGLLLCSEQGCLGHMPL